MMTIFSVIFYVVLFFIAVPTAISWFFNTNLHKKIFEALSLTTIITSIGYLYLGFFMIVTYLASWHTSFGILLTILQYLNVAIIIIALAEFALYYRKNYIISPRNK